MPGRIGFLTAIVISTGPISVPVFLSYGLVKGPFLATEAASSLAVFASKTIAFQRFGALPPEVALKGLIAGSSLMAGAFIAKYFVLRLDANVFRLVMDGLMLISGVPLLWPRYKNRIHRSDWSPEAPPQPRLSRHRTGGARQGGTLLRYPTRLSAGSLK